MAVVSIRFSDDGVRERLSTQAKRSGTSMSALAERMIDEGLRMVDHPRIVFRDGPAGRRAGLAGGPDVHEVVSTVVGSTVVPAKRVQWAAKELALGDREVEAAMAYYADYAEEIDAELHAREEFAIQAEDRWRRQQQLTAS